MSEAISLFLSECISDTTLKDIFWNDVKSSKFVYYCSASLGYYFYRHLPNIPAKWKLHFLSGYIIRAFLMDIF